jgi:hypothetical protein
MKTMTIREFQNVIRDSILAVQQGKTITFPPNGEMIQVIPERVSVKISEEEMQSYAPTQRLALELGWSKEMAEIFAQPYNPNARNEPDPFAREDDLDDGRSVFDEVSA